MVEIDISEGEVIDQYLDVPSGETYEIPAGNYEFNGGGFAIPADSELVGLGNAGDVVLNIQSGTVEGFVEGRLKNITVRGTTSTGKAGIDVMPSAEIDGFVWPEGGCTDLDRTLYAPESSDQRSVVKNSMWTNCKDNGAYHDNLLSTFENCVAMNNNVSNIRVGNGSVDYETETTYVRNCLIANTEDIEKQSGSDTPYSRGIRIREPGDFVIEDCYIFGFDVAGSGPLIQISDNAGPATVEIRNCTFYTETSAALVRHDDGSGVDVTINDCDVAGPGNYEIERTYSGTGLNEVSESDITAPRPSDLTGNPQSDEVSGLSAMDPFFADSSDGGSDGGSTTGSVVQVNSLQTGEMTYTFEQPGEHLIICHEYCGVGHHTMYGTIIVE